jgi:hypothetical protein
MTQASRDFSYHGTAGAVYGVRVVLDRNAETGLYSGHAESYKGEVENSSFLTNDIAIEPFAADTQDEAFELAFRGACKEIAQHEWIARDVKA